MAGQTAHGKDPADWNRCEVGWEDQKPIAVFWSCSNVEWVGTKQVKWDAGLDLLKVEKEPGMWTWPVSVQTDSQKENHSESFYLEYYVLGVHLDSGMSFS